MIESLIEFKKEIKEAIKIGSEELNQMLDNGLQKYTVNFDEKFRKTKTFLFRNEKIDFYDVYFPVSLEYKKRVALIPDNIDKLFERSNCISILGNAGSGKTMLLKHCFLSSQIKSSKIPIVVELRTLNSYDGTLNEYIAEQIFNLSLARNKKILERILKMGRFIFLFDGFDELTLNTKGKRLNELNSIIDKYCDNFYLLTSRPGANAESLDRFENYFVKPLTKNQINEFIIKQLRNCDDSECLINKIVSIINKEENKVYRTYLSSPLLLSMFLLTFESYPELPKSKSKFYYNVFDTLCTRHDTLSKSGGYTHEKKTNLQNEDFEDILKSFSYQSLFDGMYNFDQLYFSEMLKKIKKNKNIDCSIEDLIYDLTVSIAIILIEGIEYTFPHRSLQEYFVASLIKDLPEDIKQKVYKEKLQNLYAKIGNHGLNVDYNLWSLCEELDNFSFTECVILEQVNTILKRLEYKIDEKSFSEEQLMCNYLNLSDFQIHELINDKENNHISYSLDSSAEFLLRYINVEYLSISTITTSIMRMSKEFLCYNNISNVPNPKSSIKIIYKPTVEKMEIYKKMGLMNKSLETYYNIKQYQKTVKLKMEKIRSESISFLNLL